MLEFTLGVQLGAADVLSVLSSPAMMLMVPGRHALAAILPPD